MTDVTALVQEGLAHHQGGRLQEAAALYRRALDSAPGDAEANHLMGLLEHQAGRRDTAVRHLAGAVAAEPQNPTYHSNLGVVLQSLGRLEEAGASYMRAIALDPGIAAVHNNHGVVLHGLGRFDDALAAYRRALAIDPRYAEAHANIGLTLQALGRREEAVAAYRQAISLRPLYAKALGHLGNALRELGQPESAVDSCRAAVAIQPRDAGLHNNLGLALRDTKRPEEALDSFQRAITLKPDYAEARYNLGRLLSDIGREEEALASLRGALEIKETAATCYALGATLEEIGRLDEAAGAFRRAVELNPRDGRARSKYWRMRNHGCDWQDYEKRREEVSELVRSFGSEPGTPSIPPFVALGMLDDPELHRIAATNHSRGLLALAETADDLRRTTNNASKDGRIRIAYLSADFHEHATAYLAAGLFELHDRARFEIHAISFGPPDDSPMRKRLEASFASFREMQDAPPRAIAQAVADLGIDIAIDLKGYTQGAKTAVFAYRPAPIQVQYLGYPGTMGADFIDYVIADATVIPEAEQRHYAERIAYLPHSYQVNDRRRPLPKAIPARRDCGLPEHGFVFANFNANYKITPEVFSAWMRLLQQVEGSALWLFEGNAWARQNLCAEAAARGVDPGRLVFAGRLPLEQHLARIGNADLFLDTLPYNAHTTASDALWVGLPMVTATGRSFASRVGASLLNAVGLPELVAPSLGAYETLALQLARDPERLAALRLRLVEGRNSIPLFDTASFTRHLEAAYTRMWQLHLEGKAPETFRVAAGN